MDLSQTGNPIPAVDLQGNSYSLNPVVWELKNGSTFNGKILCKNHFFFSLQIIAQISVCLNTHNVTLLLQQNCIMLEIFCIFNANMLQKLAFDKENPLKNRLTSECIIWWSIDVTMRKHLMKNPTCALILINKHCCFDIPTVSYWLLCFLECFMVNDFKKQLNHVMVSSL